MIDLHDSKPNRAALDLACESFADSEAALLARIADLESDLAIMRAIATEAIHSLHAAHKREQTHRETIRRLLDELRALRRELCALRDTWAA